MTEAGRSPCDGDSQHADPKLPLKSCGIDGGEPAQSERQRDRFPVWGEAAYTTVSPAKQLLTCSSR
jgi:hypothetical protein